jgi:hypothetical protein
MNESKKFINISYGEEGKKRGSGVGSGGISRESFELAKAWETKARR